MIQYAEIKHITSLKNLWKKSFQSDTEDFISFYFSKVFKLEETLVICEEGTVISSLQIIPYYIKTEKSTFQAGYISGAMTDPEHRRQGHMEKLLLFSFEEMKKKGMDASFLIPQEDWLFTFYERYGYQKAFPLSLNHINDIGTTHFLDEKENYKNLNIKNLYNGFLIEKSNIVLKTKEQIDFIFEDLYISKGIFFNTPNGIALTMQENDSVHIKELFAKDKKTEEELFYLISNHYQTKDVILYQYEENKFSKYHGMIKILNPSIPIPKNIYMSMMLD